MANALLFRLIEPSGELFNAEVTEVQIPTLQGTIAVLADHMPLVTPVGAGVLEIRKSGSATDHFAVSGGMLTIDDAGATVAADAAEHAESIDELLVRQSIEEGKKALETALTEAQITATTATVQRNLIKLEAFERHRRHHASHRASNTPSSRE